MSDNLMESVAPQLAAPVTREPIQGAGETEGGAQIAAPGFPPLIMFTDDDAE